MKKSFLLLPLLGLLLAGCSNDSITLDEGLNAGGVARNYLSISMVSAHSAGTRVGEEDPQGDYETGKSNENDVKSVRFFFFDAKGNAASARKKNGTEGYYSFIDWYPSAGDILAGDKAETVEKILNATLGINVPDGESKPERVLAILNPTSQILKLGLDKDGTEGTSPVGPSLDDLREVCSDFKTGLSGGNKDEYFVMSNSVYWGEYEEGEDTKTAIIYATQLTDDNYGDDIEEAINNPVTIFVERVLARLDLSIDITNTDKDGKELENVNLTDDNGESVTLYPVWTGKVNDNESTIYVKLLGWNITGTPVKSRLVKEISDKWTNDVLFGNKQMNWNTADYHRSFWALNPDLKFPEFVNPPSESDYQFGNFGKNTGGVESNYYPAQALSIPQPNEKETTYLQENANAYSVNATAAAPEYPTKVIIAAQLVDETGEPCELAEWAYKKYTLTSLKTKLANEVLNLYKKTTNGAKKIEPDDLEFKTATELYRTEDSGDAERYYVYAVLTEEAAKNAWTLGDEQDAQVLNAAEVNQYIRNTVNHALVWKEGYTYYYFDIRHLGDALEEEGEQIPTPGYYGVVRNHIYDSKITSITGLGTPVYNPTEVIYPEKTTTDASIVSATVKILQWRVVSQEYDLKW